MFDRYVISYLDRCLAHQERRYVETLYLCCINENKLDPILRQLSIAFPSVEIGIYPGYGSVSISLRGKKRDEVTEVKKTIEDSFSSYMYLAEHGRIEEAVFACMQEKKKTLSLAESCTGGLMAHKITALAGASNFFLGSVVCYSNVMKQDILNVRLSTLKSYGAVSRQAVVEMVEGLLSTTPCDIAIAVSGVAGPSGGTPDKPVGTVWFAIGERGLGTYASKLELKGVRDTIILSATNRILGTLYRKLKYGVEIEESF